MSVFRRAARAVGKWVSGGGVWRLIRRVATLAFLLFVVVVIVNWLTPVAENAISAIQTAVAPTTPTPEPTVPPTATPDANLPRWVDLHFLYSKYLNTGEHPVFPQLDAALSWYGGGTCTPTDGKVSLEFNFSVSGGTEPYTATLDLLSPEWEQREHFALQSTTVPLQFWSWEGGKWKLVVGSADGQVLEVPLEILSVDCGSRKAVNVEAFLVVEKYSLLGENRLEVKISSPRASCFAGEVIALFIVEPTGGVNPVIYVKEPGREPEVGFGRGQTEKTFTAASGFRLPIEITSEDGQSWIGRIEVRPFACP